MLIDLQVPISVVTSLWRRQNDIEVEDKAYKDGEVAGGWGGSDGEDGDIHVQRGAREVAAQGHHLRDKPLHVPIGDH